MKIDIAHPTENGQQQETETSFSAMDFNGELMTDASNAQEIVVGDEQEDLGMREEYEQQTISTESSPESGAPLQERSSPLPAGISQKRSITRYRGLVAALVALVVVAGVVLLPALFSAQPELMSTTQPAAPIVTSVGQIAFTSSGQLDPTSSQGLNDTITLNLHNLSMPAHGQSFYAWLMPDGTDDNTIPLLLGKLSITGGTAHLTYIHPDHENLLAVYSGFEVAEQPSNSMPTTPPLDPKQWRYVGGIPDTSTPGDEQHYSLLSHMRHLLAKDPTLQQIGLQGGWISVSTETRKRSWSGPVPPETPGQEGGRPISFIAI